MTAEDLPPYLQVLIPDVSVMAGEPFTFTLEPNTFVDPNGDLFILQAELADGSPLPDWLHFDPHTLTFSGTPPAGQSGVLLVQVFVLEQQLLTAAPAALLAQADPASDEFRSPFPHRMQRTCRLTLPRAGHGEPDAGDSPVRSCRSTLIWP